MKTQDANPLVKEITEKLTRLSPDNQRQLLAFINYILQEEKYKKDNDYPSSSEKDFTSMLR